MKICAISDLHGKQPIIPKTEVLIFAGDISKMGDLQWFNQIFIPYVAKQKFKLCLVVFGNHDDGIQNSDLPQLPKNVKVLTNQPYTYKNTKFFGSPYCKASPVIIDTLNTFPDNKLKILFKEIPKDTDILITHNPPYGYGDTVINQSYHIGSHSLIDRVHIVKPAIHIFGHIHTGKKYSRNDSTRFYNVSALDDEYELKYKPTIINYATVAKWG